MSRFMTVWPPQMFPFLLQKLEEFLFGMEENQAEVSQRLQKYSYCYIDNGLTGTPSITHPLLDLNLHMPSITI